MLKILMIAGSLVLPVAVSAPAHAADDCSGNIMHLSPECVEQMKKSDPLVPGSGVESCNRAADIAKILAALKKNFTMEQLSQDPEAIAITGRFLAESKKCMIDLTK